MDGRKELESEPATNLSHTGSELSPNLKVQIPTERESSSNPSPGGRGKKGEGSLGRPNKRALHPMMLERCRSLRKNATDAENFLWQLLRDRRLAGIKFKRQVVMAGYILDFYCAQARVAVEVDGPVHQSSEQKIRDEERTRILHDEGIQVIRFENEQVLNVPEQVLLTILNCISARFDSQSQDTGC